MADLDTEIAAMQEASRRSGQRLMAIIGGVMIALGALLFFLGVSFGPEEPQRLASRSVPLFAPIALSVGGVALAFAGIYVLVKALRARR